MRECVKNARACVTDRGRVGWKRVWERKVDVEGGVPMGHESQVGVQSMRARGGGTGLRLRKYVGSGWGSGS